MSLQWLTGRTGDGRSGELQSILWEAWAALKSGAAQRSIVVVLSAVALGLSLWGAYKQKRWLDDLTKDFFVVRFPGRLPTTEKGRRRRAARAAKTRAERARELWLRIATLFALGMLAPSVFLYFGTIFYDWFDPTVLPLALKGSSAPAAPPPTGPLMLYVADQLMRGGLFDAFEVFRIPLGGFTNNPKATSIPAASLPSTCMQKPS